MLPINGFAVVAAAVSSFLLGGLWYSPMAFGPLWQREAGAPDKADGHPARVFAVSLAFALLAAVAYAWLVPPAADLDHAAMQGLVVGAGVVAASFGINYQFASRSLRLLLIDGGYHTLQFIIYGVMLGLWR